MTDDRPYPGQPDPEDPPLGDPGFEEPAFEEDVRRMLRRRSGDVDGVGGVDRIGGVERIGGVGEPIDRPARRSIPVAGAGVPWTRRFGMVAAAAAVIVVAAVGLLSLRDDAEPVTVGSDGGGSGPAAGRLLLPPQGDEAEVVSLSIISAMDLERPGDVLLAYGPTEAMIDDGLVVLVEPLEMADLPSPTPSDGSAFVTTDQDPALAELGAVLSDDVLSWIDPGDGETPARAVTLLWYGDDLSSDDVLAIAGRMAPDPAAVVGPADLPDGWAFRLLVDDLDLVGATLDAQLVGAVEARLSSGGVPLPLGIFRRPWAGPDGRSTEIEEVSVRGAAGLLSVTRYEGDGGADGSLDEATVVELAWLETGAMHQIVATASVDEVLALAERLVPVDEATARRRAAELDGFAGDQAATSVVPTTLGLPESPQTTTGPAPAPFDPGVSMTAPGPGAVGAPGTVVGGSGSTTGPPSTPPATGSGPATSGPPTTPPATTVPVSRPNGSFTDNSIVPVATATFGATPYEVGVSWSPRFGLCLGIDLDGDLTGGGYPVECETEPWIGAAGRREVPGEGTIVFAFVADDPAVATADFVVADRLVSAGIDRLDAFPGFAFLVFPVEGITADEIDRNPLAGSIVLYDEDGDALGWG